MLVFSDMVGTVNCTFDTDEWCGYYDLPQSQKLWFRSHSSGNDNSKISS